MSSLTTSNTEQSHQNNNIDNQNNHNIYIKVPRLSLVIDTEFNDNDDTSSPSKKVDYYTQMNKNKRYFLNLLK